MVGPKFRTITHKSVLTHLCIFQDSDRWLSSLQKSIRAQTPHLMAVDEVEERLLEAVMARPYEVTQAFQEADFANMGVVSKEDFKNTINKTLFRLSDEQVGSYWCSVVNKSYRSHCTLCCIH